MTAQFVIPLSHVSKEDELQVGSKVVTLSQVQNLASVAPGFVLTTSAFTHFLEKTGLQENFNKALRLNLPSNPENLTRSSAQIHSLIMSKKMPDDLALEIFAAYHLLKTRAKGLRRLIHSIRQNNPTVTVSSGQSGNAAGVETVSGESNLIMAIQRFWSWHFSPKGIIHHDFPSVLVQACVETEVTALVQISKTSKSKAIARIEAVWGSADLFKQGKVTGDTLEVDLEKKTVIFEARTSQQAKHLQIPNQAPKVVSLSGRIAKERKLTTSQAVELSKLAAKLDHHFYFPQAYEFSLAKNQIRLLDVNPQNHASLESEYPASDKKVDDQVTDKPPQVTSQRPSSNWHPLLKATSAGKGIHAGPVKILRNQREQHKVSPGDVLVISYLTKDFIPAIRKAGAVIIESSIEFSSPYQLIKDRGIPFVSEATNSTSLLKDNQVLIVHAGEGKLYTFT